MLRKRPEYQKARYESGPAAAWGRAGRYWPLNALAGTLKEAAGSAPPYRHAGTSVALAGAGRIPICIGSCAHILRCGAALVLFFQAIASCTPQLGSEQADGLGFAAMLRLMNRMCNKHRWLLGAGGGAGSCLKPTVEWVQGRGHDTV